MYRRRVQLLRRTQHEVRRHEQRRRVREHLEHEHLLVRMHVMTR